MDFEDNEAITTLENRFASKSAEFYEYDIKGIFSKCEKSMTIKSYS